MNYYGLGFNKGEATIQEGSWWDDGEYETVISGDIYELYTKEYIDENLIAPEGKEFECWYESFDSTVLPEVLEESHKYQAGSDYTVPDLDNVEEITMIAVWKDIPQPEVKIYDSVYSIKLAILKKL